jgi:hypothetical protein
MNQSHIKTLFLISIKFRGSGENSSGLKLDNHSNPGGQGCRSPISWDWSVWQERRREDCGALAKRETSWKYQLTTDMIGIRQGGGIQYCKT